MRTPFQEMKNSRGEREDVGVCSRIEARSFGICGCERWDEMRDGWMVDVIVECGEVGGGIHHSCCFL